MYKIRTQQDECKCIPFVNDNPSETLPHQAMTIEEIYLSIAQGIIPDLVNYAEEDPFNSQDLTDFDDSLATVVNDDSEDSQFAAVNKPVENESKTATPVADDVENV